jgi:hypothetical protein
MLTSTAPAARGKPLLHPVDVVQPLLVNLRAGCAPYGFDDDDEPDDFEEFTDFEA